MMNTRPQITRVEDKIRIPDWRSASPKNRSTRPPHTSRRTRTPNLVIPPRFASQSAGRLNQPLPIPDAPLRAHEADCSAVHRHPHRGSHPETDPEIATAAEPAG